VLLRADGRRGAFRAQQLGVFERSQVQIDPDGLVAGQRQQ